MIPIVEIPPLNMTNDDMGIMSLRKGTFLKNKLKVYLSMYLLHGGFDMPANIYNSIRGIIRAIKHI